MTWCTIPKAVEFNISQALLGEGAFCKAYKAKPRHNEFLPSTSVVKEHKSCALEVIPETKQSVETHTKVVQMHWPTTLQRSLETTCNKINLEIHWSMVTYASLRKVKNMSLLKHKWRGNLTNTSTMMEASAMAEIISAKAESLAHYSYKKSNNQLLLLDIQGCGYRLIDPEIASFKLMDEEEVLFPAGTFYPKKLSTTLLRSMNAMVIFLYCN